MAKALTLDELQDLMMESGINLHIWIKFIELDTVYAAVTDVADGVGVVAIWCAGDEDDWLRADTYGIEWLAYLEKPEVSDRWNLVGAHLNGMEPRGEIRKVEVSPWFEAIAKRHKKRMNYRHANIKTAEDIRKRIISARKQLLGSDLSVNKLVRVDKKPWEAGVEELADYLADKAYAIMCREYGSKGNGPWCKDWFEGFFRYTTLYFANGRHGTLDDYILFAECFEHNPNAIRIVFSENLPPELADEAEKWVIQNEDAPLDLSRCVVGAVACFTGAMAGPEEMEE